MTIADHEKPEAAGEAPPAKSTRARTTASRAASGAEATNRTEVNAATATETAPATAGPAPASSAAAADPAPAAGSGSAAEPPAANGTPAPGGRRRTAARPAAEAPDDETTATAEARDDVAGEQPAEPAPGVPTESPKPARSKSASAKRAARAAETAVEMTISVDDGYATPDPDEIADAVIAAVMAQGTADPEGQAAAVLDTIPRAVATPELAQPYAELGLTTDEYAKIRTTLGRRPTDSELYMYSIMWSEHCSYKSSKVHLRQFAEKAPRSDRLLAGMGENAGVIAVTDRIAVTFKIESHNHPSFVEPHQGAATGIGGIVRDILAMGARPIAVMDPLRFGAIDHPDTGRVLSGVVAGVGGYGNCLGLPNIGGELVFDPCYQANPLLNALCLGVLPTGGLQSKAASGPGNIVVLLGAKTGRDGIGGASILASATFDADSQARRPSVQVGDPFTEKLLIEACLEMYASNLIVGVQDLGAAGISCALAETAAGAGTGIRAYLERVPLREPSMAPHEILASESQERMLLIVAPEKLRAVFAVAERWGVLATDIGEVTDTGRLIVTWHGEGVVDVPPGSLADDGPVYARPMREPAERPLLQVDRAETLPRPRSGDDLRETLLRMVASPNLCDKSFVTEQYDRYVLGNTVLAQPEDGGMIRLDEETGLGVALATDGNSRYTRLDPYAGAQLALAEAYRNVAMTGAVPVAVTNCLNFGSPEDPAVMWQFAEAVRGLADGCAMIGIPVTGGNVSFYNQTGTVAIHPTPIVGVLGIIGNVAERVPIGFTGDGDLLFLLGETREELSGSEWAWVEHRHLGGTPPRVDLAAERRLAAVVTTAAVRGHLASAHDISDGGLAQALTESCLRRGLGATVTLPANVSPFVALFSESTARALISVPRGHDKAFTALCDEYGQPWTAIGVVEANSGALDIRDQFSVSVADLREAHSGTLERHFGAPAGREHSGGSAPEAGPGGA